MTTVKIFFWVSLLSIFITWLLYPVSVYILARLKKTYGKMSRLDSFMNNQYSIIIAAYNEERNVKERIQNLDSLKNKRHCEILLASDGSTDSTVTVAESLSHPQVRVFDFNENRGRAIVHNDCARMAKGDVLVFTDAETRFDPDFIKQIDKHFSDPAVGGVCGRIVYLNENKSGISESAGFYWKYEEMIRQSESILGVLAFGTGACLAIRKNYYHDIGATEDIDYAATLDLVGDGYRIVYEPNAKAYDFISETSEGAYQTRVRQTSRSFKSIIKRIFSRKIFFKPGLFLSALCHKTFRHLTPFFMITALICNILLLKSGFIYVLLLIAQCSFYILGLMGYKKMGSGFLCKICSMSYTFTVINIARFVGVISAIIGKQKAYYQTMR